MSGMAALDRARVLVVEDEEALSAALADGLRKDGFRVEVVDDGLLALDVSITHPYDVIVLDLMLPSLSGLDVCARLREAGIDTPVLVLTARNTESDQIHALRTGADDFLSKP